MSGPGHNSGDVDVGGIASDRLRSIIERIERNREEIKAFREQEKDLMTEAKSAGFDAKIVRKVLQRRAMDAAEREEQDTLLDLYERALGLL